MQVICFAFSIPLKKTNLGVAQTFFFHSKRFVNKTLLQTLKFKTQLTTVFFAAVNHNYGNSQQILKTEKKQCFEIHQFTTNVTF